MNIIQCTLLKVDSNPRQNGTALFLKARFQGVYLYPSLPNVTSLQQKMDISYGPFKSVVWMILKKIASACFLQQIKLLLRIYGGVCLDLGNVLENALQAPFNAASNLYLWSKVGAVPYTKKCLLNPKVWHDGMDMNNLQFNIYQDVQS
jgi:hypothetical protein